MEQTIPLPKRPDPNLEENNLVRNLFQYARLAEKNDSAKWPEISYTTIDSVQRHWMRYWLRTPQEFQPGQLTSESQEGSLQFPIAQIIEGLNYLMQWTREHQQPDPHYKDRRVLYRYLIRFLKEQAAIPACQGESKAQHYIVIRSTPLLSVLARCDAIRGCLGGLGGNRTTRLYSRPLYYGVDPDGQLLRKVNVFSGYTDLFLVPVIHW